MTENDNPSQDQSPTPPPLDRANRALVAALTAAILAARRDVSPPDQRATAAATQYAEIKGALRTHSEPIPVASTSKR
jgi:hypothetical protein